MLYWCLVYSSARCSCTDLKTGPSVAHQRVKGYILIQERRALLLIVQEYFVMKKISAMNRIAGTRFAATIRRWWSASLAWRSVNGERNMEIQHQLRSKLSQPEGANFTQPKRLYGPRSSWLVASIRRRLISRPAIFAQPLMPFTPKWYQQDSSWARVRCRYDWSLSQLMRWDQASSEIPSPWHLAPILSWNRLLVQMVQSRARLGVPFVRPPHNILLHINTYNSNAAEP